MEYESICMRITRLWVRAKPRNLYIVEVYTATSNSSDEDLDALYDHSRLTLNKNTEKVYQNSYWRLWAKVGANAYKDWCTTAGCLKINAIYEML